MHQSLSWVPSFLHTYSLGPIICQVNIITNQIYVVPPVKQQFDLITQYCLHTKQKDQVIYLRNKSLAATCFCTLTFRRYLEDNLSVER